MSKPSPAFDWLSHVVENPPENCAIWPYSTGNSGYGRIYFLGSFIGAHRLALSLYTGTWHSSKHGIVTRHGPCNNKLCCNPLHLSWGTPAQNSRDMVRDGTKPFRKLNEDQVRSIRGDVRVRRVISEEYGISERMVYLIQVGEAWAHVEGPITYKIGVTRKGVDNANAKLSEEEVIEIYLDPRIHRIVAEDYGVSRDTVGKIKKGHTWGCLTKSL